MHMWNLRFAQWTKHLSLAFCLGLLLHSTTMAQILRLPYPESSTNGALHYNRAILSLASLPTSERECLTKPIWEVFGSMSKDEIDETLSKLLFAGRHALRATLKGSDQMHAEFGVDYADFGKGGILPHAQPMLQLGRLTTLAGISAQIDEQWEEAAHLFFQSLRIGKHMTDQPTFVESLVGVEVLEGNYHSLAFWGSKCPDTSLVKQAYIRLDVGARAKLQPMKTLAYEAAITQRQISNIQAAFPDGEWPEMLLETLGEMDHGRDREAQKEKAIEQCCKRGTPRDIFDDKAKFDAYGDKIRDLHVAFLEESAACMDLPPKQRVASAKAVMKSFEPRFRKIGEEVMFDVVQVGRFFATHDAQQTMARVALAVAANRTDAGFPESLDSVPFKGGAPNSPYDGSAIEYQRLNDGKDFSVTLNEVTIDNVVFPAVVFSSVRE